MYGPIRDRLGRSLILLFLLKPVIDLGYFLSFRVAGIRLAPTTVAGFLICLYFARFRFSGSRIAPPYLGVFEAFLLVNLVSIMLGVVMSDNAALNPTLIFLLKILNSYFIFYAAYLASVRGQYEDVTPFVRAIVTGSAIAVVANFVAIQAGYAGPLGPPDPANAFRERGLYYDAGVLANIAFFNLIFSVFLLHMQKRGLAWTILILFLIIIDLYLIAASKSRSVMIELAVFAMFYTWLFQKRFGRVLAPVIGIIVVSAALLIFDISVDELFMRFEGDIAALEEEGTGIGVSSGLGGEEVSLGRFEALGSNRGMLWASGLTEIFNRSAIEILLGDFYSTSLAHSDYIDVMGRNGIIGLALYLTLLFALLRLTFAATRRRQPESRRALHFVAFILLVCYMLYSMPFRPLSYTTSAWYMWVMLALSLGSSRVAQLQQVQAKAERAREDHQAQREPEENADDEDQDEAGRFAL